MSNRPHNAFLRDLNAETFDRLSPHLTEVGLRLGDFVHHAEESVEWVYFPQTCLLSMIATGPSGQTVETSMSGNEGAAGLLEACASRVSGVDCVVQIDGRAWRASAVICRALANSDHSFSSSVLKLAELQLAESRQSVFCQAVHGVEQRFARWMGESSDRCGGRNPLPMTQQFLAAMLGVQRTTVTAFASLLQRQGVIRYRRGVLEIADRPKLEALACECRQQTILQRKRLGFEALAVCLPES
jgi:CRP-like cAMP-binding protein